MENGRPLLRVGRHRELVERGRTSEAAEDREDGLVAREAEASPALVSARSEMGLRYRPADDPVLRALPARNVVGEEHGLRERRAEAVGQPEVRVRLGQGGGYAAQASCEHHRPGNVAACAQNDVGVATTQDPEARERRPYRTHHGSHEAEPEPAREAGDVERVELEARLRNQPRLDEASRPGERHRYPPLAQRLGDCERRPNVPGGAACRDQARELRRLAH